MEAKPKLRPVSVTPDLLVAAVHSVLLWVMRAQEGGGMSPALNVSLALQKGSGQSIWRTEWRSNIPKTDNHLVKLEMIHLAVTADGLLLSKLHHPCFVSPLRAKRKEVNWQASQNAGLGVELSSFQGGFVRTHCVTAAGVTHPYSGLWCPPV